MEEFLRFAGLIFGASGSLLAFLFYSFPPESPELYKLATGWIIILLCLGFMTFLIGSWSIL